MIRRFVLVLLCGTLLLVASAGRSAAQDADRPSQKLWTQVALEPTATPAADAPRATPTPHIVEPSGMGAGTLILLVVAAAAAGGVTARVAWRWRRRQDKAALPGGDPPPIRDEPGTPALRPAGEEEPSGLPAPSPAVTPRPAPVTPHTTAPSPVETGEQPAAATPAPPLDQAGTKRPLILRARPLRPRDDPPPDTKQRDTAPPAPLPQPTQPAAPHEPPLAPPRESPPRGYKPAWVAGPMDAESCTIALATRANRACFVAIASEDDHEIARSPRFPLDDSGGTSAISPRDALSELVEELQGAGWRQSGVGAKPWQLVFRREVEAPQRAER